MQISARSFSAAIRTAIRTVACPLLFAIVLATGLAGIPATRATAEDLSEPPFGPTWELMNRIEKQNFIAGYLYGMKDAATMTRVLGDFVRDNPTAAAESLERLRTIYGGLADGKAPSVVEGIDRFFKNPENRQAPLSRAITGARAAQ